MFIVGSEIANEILGFFHCTYRQGRYERIERTLCDKDGLRKVGGDLYHPENWLKDASKLVSTNRLSEFIELENLDLRIRGFKLSSGGSLAHGYFEELLSELVGNFVVGSAKGYGVFVSGSWDCMFVGLEKWPRLVLGTVRQVPKRRK